MFFVTRDLGFVHKIFRGLADPEVEKLWVAAAETYAIGGACQLLHVVDHVIAARGCRLYLPARKEGIIPGASNLRLPRFVGDRLARQAILSGLEFEAGTPPAELICDEVVDEDELDAALSARIDALTSSGLVNAAANRRALRIGQEPLDVFRSYMATFSREQAYCHLSPALVATWRSTGEPMSATSERAVWDAVETLPRPELRALQLERLRATVGRVLAGPAAGDGPAARGRCDRARRHRLARRRRARSRSAVKADLRDSYPFGLLAVPREQLVRVHASSGSHGKPTVVGYTRADLDAWTELMARCMTMAGVRPGMVVHNANGYGLFTGGHGFHEGGERIGATVIPVSGGFTARQAMLLRDLGGQVLCATPSYALVIAQAVRDAGIDPSELRLELGLFGGEPWTDEMRAQLERELGLTRRASTACRRCAGPAWRPSASARDGLHVQEDHFLVEVVDPDSGELLPEGEEGELVFTTLAKEALPLIRYRTGDIGSVTSEPCALRAHARAYPRAARAARRHADRARGEPVPLERGAPAPRRGRGGAALPADRGATGADGRADGGVRAGGGRRRPGGAGREARAAAARAHRDPDRGVRGRARRACRAARARRSGWWIGVRPRLRPWTGSSS